MRIASLVPSATEAVCALGLGDQLVAVTHECDHPAEVRSLPRLTRSVLAEGLDAGEIDARVKELTGKGAALYELDEVTLAALEPNVVVTQSVCEVCAVSFDDVRAVAERIPSRPQVLSLDPSSLEEVLDDLLRLSAAAGTPGRGVELRAHLERRLARVASGVQGAPRPRVAALEWLDPPYAAGHWIPEMIELAGGRSVLGEARARSREVPWEEVREARPEIVVAMPCGLDAAAAAVQTRRFEQRLADLSAERIIAVDAAASYSRPGPRLVDGVELLAHLLHPTRLPPPPDLDWAVID